MESKPRQSYRSGHQTPSSRSSRNVHMAGRGWSTRSHVALQSGRWLSCAAVGLPCVRGDRVCSSRMRGLPSSAFLQLIKRARDETSQPPLTGLIILIIISFIIISYNEKSLKMLLLFTGFQCYKACICNLKLSAFCSESSASTAG